MCQQSDVLTILSCKMEEIHQTHPVLNHLTPCEVLQAAERHICQYSVFVFKPSFGRQEQACLPDLRSVRGVSVGGK